MSKKQTTVIFVLVVTVLLAIIVAACIYVIRNDNRLKNLESLLSKQPKIVQPVQVKDGYTPIKGIDYNDGVNGSTPDCYFEESQCRGKDSISTHTNTITNEKETIIKEVPIEGRAGPAGLTQQIELDTVSCILKSKYITDDIWTDIAQLPKPCKVE